VENKKLSINQQDVPSTSKYPSFQGKEDNVSNKKMYVDQQNINESIYFVSKSRKSEELNLSPSIESDNSNGSLSENSVNFSPEDSVSEDDIILQGML